MSSKAETCPHCGFARGELSEEEALEFQRRKLRDRIYHLKMTSYAVISVFVGGFGWYWWDTGEFQRMSSAGPLLLLAVAAVGYLAVRVMLALAKRNLKKLG